MLQIKNISFGYKNALVLQNISFNVKKGEHLSVIGESGSGKSTLLKAFAKLEKPIKETYVLFQVDETQGLAQIKEKRQELTDMAKNALTTAQEQTKKINPNTPVPEGIFQGTLYKLNKKFL